MTTVNYYIENLSTGKTLQLDGSWEQFVPNSSYVNGNSQTISVQCLSKDFSDWNSALTHIGTLPNGEYRIFSRIVKS